MSSRTRQRVSATLGLGLAVAALQLVAPPAAVADPDGAGLVISEVYGGGGNSGSTLKNDFIELYNPTAQPISVDGWSVQGRSATNTATAATPANVTPLTGSVPAGGYYLVQEAAGTGGTQNLPTPDATGSMALAAGGWQIWLSNGTTPLDPADGNVLTTPDPAIIDFVGGATNAASFETARVTVASTASQSITRNATNSDTDSNAADFALATPTPTNTVNNATPLTLAAVSAKTATVGKPITGFSLAATGGTTPYAYSATGLPTGLSVDATTGAVSGTPTEAGSYEVTAKVVDSATPAAERTQTFTFTVSAFSVTNPGTKAFIKDEAITPFTIQVNGGTAPFEYAVTTGSLPAGVNLDPATGEVSGTPTAKQAAADVTVTVTDADDTTATTTFSVRVDELLSIADVQGTGATSPVNNTTVTTQGVVTAMYRTGGYNGMYVQTPGADTPGASDAVFVWGSNSMPAGVEIGDSVRVTGAVTEFGGTTAVPATLTEITPAAGGVVELATSLGAVTVKQVAYPTSDEGREALEGELLELTDTFTVTNSYNTNFYAEVGLATGTTPLKQMTEYAAPNDVDAIEAIKAENYQRAVTLDDGSSTNYGSGTARNSPLPYLTNADGSANPIRVGAEATLESPVILEWRNSLWKIQPTSQVTTNGASVATFEDTRSANEVPQDVLGADGDLKIATFNVLNYFNTTGEAYVAVGPQQNPPIVTHCTYYTDRGVPAPAKPIGNDQCGVKQPGETYTSSNPNDGRGPRGAASAESLARQEAKLTNTLIDLDAEVIGLEEVENSIKLPGETNRDDAVIRIVELLNAKAGAGTWSYVKSPGEALTATAVAEQDVIRPAFIYQTASVEPVGQSDILFGSTEFANAREPLAQAFKAKGAPDADAFAVIVNHFKSKGDNAAPAPPADGDNKNDAVTGVGAFNGDRTRQAARLVQFAEDFAADRGIEAVFLAGDFNSYTMEEPIDVLEAGGFELVESDQADDESYSYSGLSGSLDHVLGNEAAMDLVTGADIWEINADESVAFQYSRYNYNVTDFWQPALPFATSDHNPEIVGLDLPAFTPTTYKEIQVIGTNDFHGRLLPDGGNAAGAGPFATAVKELESQNPNSVFVAAGDLVGASTFESFIQDDEPTIDALNEMGLEVSAAGNHEFDRGYADFVGRIQDRADWEYIAANVEEPEGQPDKLAETWTKTIDGIKVGFVGAVTEDLPALVNPAGIQGVSVTDVVEATNAAAAALRSGADPVDLVVLLVHEGSPSTDCTSSSFTDAATTWGNIVQNTSSDVDAIISGHTHLAYNCRYTVEDWVTEGRAVTKRPVVSAGQYGTNLNRLVFKYDEATGDLAAISQDVVAAAGVGYASDPTVQAIVDDAVEYAEEAGAEVLGSMGGPFLRASYNAQGTSLENRGGESTLSNQVAEVQRWATDTAGIDTDIAFMNPGGLRADMAGTLDGAVRDLTYRQAADVQPFANTLVNMELTGAQIETVLEQQWQRNAQGGVPSRPFLRLGISEGFTYTYTETPETVSVPNSAPVSTFRGEVTGMWLDGKAIDPEKTYSVTVNSFLGGGGDNFWELANGAEKVDSGQVDLEAMVDYMDQYDAAHPLPVDYSQRAVEVTFPGAAPATYAPGATVTFDVASWAMTAAGDKTDAEIEVRLAGQVIGTAPVTNTAPTTAYDNAGTATVSVTLPANAADGTRRLRLVGATTGTSIVVPIEVQDGDGVEDIQILATNDFHGRLARSATSAEAGAAVLSGAVKQLREENPNTVFAAAGDLIGASTFESFIQHDKPTIDALNEAGLEVSAAGNHEFDAGYDDLVNRVMADYDAETNPEGGAEWQYIAANVRLKSNDSHAIPASWIRDFGDVEVGFVGAVTEDLPTLVSPSGIDELKVTGVVQEANAEAEALKAEGADIVVLLVHEGAATTALSSATDDSAFGKIVKGVDGDIDAIVSGHTHLAYNHAIPVPEWVAEGRDVTTRPVVSAGQYGYNLNKLVFSYDTTADEVVGIDQSVVALQSCTAGCAGTTQTWSPNYTADPVVTDIVSAANAKAETLGARKLGEIGSPFSRAKLANGTSENRGGESTLGNLVAEVQRWATEQPEAGSAQIAFMNPGGLRDDMLGSGNGTYPRDLTYKQAAVVQPFANTLVNMDLTGAQIKTVLEQQWQRDTANKLPSRPFLRLGISDGFTYTYSVRTVTETPTDETPAYQAPKGTVTGMWLDGEPISPTETYSVTVNSFLASGGDNFRELANGTGKQDTGKVDLQAMVDYLAASEGAVSADYRQRSVGVTFPVDAPASYAPGEEVAFAASSLAFSTAADTKDTSVTVLLGDTPLRTTAVDNTLGTAVYDEYGTAAVTFVVPPGTPAGPTEFRLVGDQTGTEVPVSVDVAATTGLSVGDETITWGDAATFDVTVTGNDGTPTGEVEVFEGTTKLGEASLTDGVAAVTIAAKSVEPGVHDLEFVYSGDSSYEEMTGEASLTVEKASSAIAAANVSLTWGETKSVTVTLDASATGTVEIRNGSALVGSAPVTNGVATVSLPARSLEPGVTTLTASYAGDGHVTAGSTTFTATVAKATSSISAGDVSFVYGKSATVTVNVDPAATGTIEVKDGSRVLGSAAVANGAATVTLPKESLQPGSTTLTAAYSGDGHFQAASSTLTANVDRARSKTNAKAKPAKVVVKRTRATISVEVDGVGGVEATGKVKISVPGQGSETVTLRNGRATLKLDAFASVGKRTVNVQYLGSDLLDRSTDKVVVTVRKR